MNKVELINKVAATTGITKKNVTEVVNAVFDTIKDTIGNGDDVSVCEFGKFICKTRAERNGVNPNTLEPIVISEQKTVGFKPSKVFKDIMKK